MTGPPALFEPSDAAHAQRSSDRSMNLETNIATGTKNGVSPLLLIPTWAVAQAVRAEKNRR